MIVPPHCNILRSEITVQILQHDFDDVTTHEVNDHKTGHDELELRAEGHEFQPLVDLRDELRRARESYTRHEDKAPIHAAVLADTFSEGATLIVDSEGRDLLDELEQINGAVEQGGFEFAFEVDLLGSGLDTLNVIGEVDEGDNVDGELAENGTDDVWIEDVGLGTFFGEAFDRLGDALVDVLVVGNPDHTLAREIERKQTLMSMPLIVTWPSPNLMPSKYNTLKL